MQELADSLHLRATWDEVDDFSQPLVVLSFDMEGVSEDEAETNGDEQTAEAGEDGDEWESEGNGDVEAEAEGDIALTRVFNKYEKAKVVENTVDDFEESYEETMKQKIDEWKKGYYKVGPTPSHGYQSTCRTPTDMTTSAG